MAPSSPKPPSRVRPAQVVVVAPPQLSASTSKPWVYTGVNRMGQREGEGDDDSEGDPVLDKLGDAVADQLRDAVAVLDQLTEDVGDSDTDPVEDTEMVPDGDDDAVTLGVTLGEVVREGDVVGVGDTQAPVPVVRATRPTARASMTRPWSSDADTCSVADDAVCCTSNCRARLVSRPDPAGMPRGLMGDPHKSPEVTGPTMAPLVAPVSNRVRVARGVPSRVTLKLSPTAQESMVRTVS